MKKLYYIIPAVLFFSQLSVNAQCDSLRVAVSKVFNVSCYGDSNGLIAVVATGDTASYQYTLNAGAWQTSDTFTNLVPGNYLVTVKDSVGCIYTDSTRVYITQPPLLSVSINATAVTTNGGGANGTATAIALGGTAPYHCYNWSNGGVDSNITHLQQGRYCVTVCDASNCTATACDSVVSINYHYLLDTINIWHYAYYFVYVDPVHNGNNNSRSLPVCGDPTQRGIVWTGADSVFNNLTYRQVNVSNSFYQVSADSCYLGLIREDTLTGKVYFIRDSSDTEILLYNFGMQVGQKMNIAFTDSNGHQYQYNVGNRFHNGTYTLNSITTTNIAAGLRKQYNLTCDSDYEYAVTWVESVGCLADVLYPNSWINDNLYNYFVVCFEHNNHVYFDTSAYNNVVQGGFNCEFSIQDSCDFEGGCGGIQELSSLSSFTAYPVPASDNVSLRLDVTQDASFDIHVKDMEGRDAGIHLSLGNLSPGTYTHQLSVANLSPGFYIIECRTDMGSLYSKMMVQR